MKRRLIRPLTILLLVAVFGCSENVDTITYETPQVSEEGETELTIEVIDAEDAAVTGYDIAIEGPTTVSESGVGSSAYTFTDLQSGTYSITITKEGYLEAETEAEVELPEEATGGFSSEVLVVLTKKTPPVKVDNSQDTTVETAPSNNPGEEGLTTTLNIPAGSFPDDVVNEDGTVDLSVTRSNPNNVIETEEGTVDDVILFDPEGTELNNPIEVSIPIEVPQELEGNIQYVLMPGNIPLELTENAQSAMVAAGSAGYQAVKKGTAEIEILGEYYVVADVEVRQSGATFTEPVVVETSGCGEGVDAEYSIDVVPPGQAIQRFVSGYAKNSRTVTKSLSKNGVEGLKITVRGQHKTKTITLLDGDGNTILEETVNLPAIRLTVETSNCHNSGGG